MKITVKEGPTHTITKVSANGHISTCVMGVIINGTHFIATDKCRKKYNNGNPIKVLKFNLN
jgi:hypothetical protein